MVAAAMTPSMGERAAMQFLVAMETIQSEAEMAMIRLKESRE